MFDIGWQELFVLAVLAIIVIGPKDLPRAIKTVTHWIRKARGMARDLQDGLDDMVREAELDDIKAQANSIMSDDFDPTGTIAKEFDMEDEARDWSTALDDLKDATDPNRKADPADAEIDAEIDAVDTGESGGGAAAEAAPEPEPAPEPKPAPQGEKANG